MSVWDRTILWGFMVLLAGAASAGVNYSDHICAVKGSTVTLLCTFTPLQSVRQNRRQVLVEIVRVRWCQNHLICHGTTPSVYDSDSENNAPRYKYLGDKKGNCTLQIADVQKEDEATFRFRMEANNNAAHYTGTSGVNVTVSDDRPMMVNSSSSGREVRAGENVTLYCTAPCTFHQLEVTWFKDDHALSEPGPALQLGPVTAEDSGNYTCGLRNNAGTRSLPYSLHVEAEQEQEGGSNLSLVVGVVCGVLLALVTLIMILCIIKRKWSAAADKDRRAVGGEVEQKRPDNIYSDVLPPTEPEGGGDRQETGRAVEEVSYVSVQFKHKNQDRPAMEAEDTIIYSAVASRG
ncbi:leucine-rich repeats and immunoglobulin-like domains protein 1 [Chelmon rostratus]|uniref:leucine-rich repeats and immunoglobulin-like domains protein 1 n=1 Tax=Chelmon rostratus TaxID=109905 RepID=UPI001BEA1B7B|nr:leucine-rich repeats and immunoglobulin-like domains protein 1 [Chelmon rostratus]